MKYESALGIRQSYEEAVRWYRAAAEQGLSIAQRFLGDMYDSGKGVPLNYTEASEWYRKAAEQGDPQARGYLYEMYSTGRGVEQGDAEAAKWKVMPGIFVPNDTGCSEEFIRALERLLGKKQANE